MHLHPTSFRWTTTALVVLLTVSLVRSQFSYEGIRRLKISPKECISSKHEGITGICMFNLECQEKAGTVIGACVDRFLFGACCYIPDYKPEIEAAEPTQTVPAQQTSTTSTTTTTSSTTTATTEPTTTTTTTPPTTPTTTTTTTTERTTTTTTTTTTTPWPTTSTTTTTARPTTSITTTTTTTTARPSTSTTTAKSTTTTSRPTTTAVPRTTQGITALSTPPIQNVPTSQRPHLIQPNGADAELREVPAHYAGYAQPESSTGGGLNDQPADPPISPVRFPVRPSAGPSLPPAEPHPVDGVPAENASSQALVSLHPPHNPLPAGEFTTLPSTRHTGPLLPVALETFSSVSDPISYGPSGNHDDLHHSHGQSIVSLESATLNTVQNQYFTAQTTFPSSDDDDMSSGGVTVDPPKLSTFMYVDLSGAKNDNLSYFDYSSNINSNHASTGLATEETPGVVDRTTTNAPHIHTLSESLNGGLSGGNTENVWAVMLQLASHVRDTTESEVKLDSDELFTSLSGDKPSDPGSSNHKEAVAPVVDDVNLSDIWKITTTSSVSGDAPTILHGDEQTTEDAGLSGIFHREDSTENLSIPSTPRPWASSTYQVHTFRYPEEKLTTTVKPPERSTVGPTSGQLTTWYGTVPVRTTAAATTTVTTSTTTEKFIPSTTTFFPLITAKRTIRTTARPTTSPATEPTTARTTVGPRPTTTERIILSRPPIPDRPYTLPPKKRPTPGSIDDLAPPTKRPTISPFSGIIFGNKGQNKRPDRIGMGPGLKDRDPESSMFQDDLEANLDDFVNQVVQGLAGSLDSLDFDDVILSASARPPLAPSTLHPLSVLSDPLFPPFPVVGKVPLSKPGKTGMGKPGLVKPAGIGVKATQPPKKVTTMATTTTTTPKPLDYRKDCGVRPLMKQGRIVGGSPAKFGRWPWQALVREATWLGLFSKNKCGGVLIAPKYVLTAAHCQPGFLATLTVVLGDFDISTDGEAGNKNAITKNVKRVIVHRDYNAQTFENDIAILELESPIEYQQHIVPICLPNEKDVFIGKQAYVTGWGRLKYGGGVPQQLHEVDVPIINNTECQQMFLKSGHIKAIRDSFICAGYAQGLKDSCEGDSGGPLAMQRPGGQWVLAGTVSHGIKCAYPNLPGVYMRMTFYKPWIKRVTGVS